MVGWADVPLGYLPGGLRIHPFGERPMNLDGLFGKIKKNLALQVADVLRWCLADFSLDEIETITRHIAERRSKRVDNGLMSFSRSFVRYHHGFPNRFDENGERALIDRVASLGFEVLFDVGANRGVWSDYAYRRIPGATVHAFEIVRSTFDNLRAALPMDPRIKLNPFGLDEKSGMAEVFVSESDLLSSLYDFDLGGSGRKRSIRCKVRGGDEYCEENKIEKIDFLKIDVEGAERRVLLGFMRMLRSGSIRMLQFEYNRGAIVGGFLLKDAYAFLGMFGYMLGRLTPRGVIFHDYHFSHEDFIGPNYVACKPGDAMLIDAISSLDHCHS
jgi:FkbM family methyltransferase